MQFIALLAPFVLLPSNFQQDKANQVEPYAPQVKPASSEGLDAISRMTLPADFQCELVAAEPHLANPVCFWPAADGSFYVAETFRLHSGVTDMREHVELLEDDMACDTVEDRVAMFKRWSGDQFKQDYAQEHERIKRLRDTDGDGIVDQSTVFADGFNEASAGIAAGLLEHDGAVYYTCIPHLWKLTDSDGDGVADERLSLSSGYGVRVTLLGHDLHGLQIGSDGWLYFSCGDRGFHVQTADGVLAHPDTGAVLRCKLDGSQLEIYHTGLRNPQELAFDAHGNLFTGDNNSDGGDQARWVQVVEGADSGWRSSYQWIFDPVARGPWNVEELWKPHFEGQAAYILPPLANIANGPSGLAYYPGTGLGKEFDGTFLLCDFRGGASFSGIHAFQLDSQGASFDLVNRRQFLWGTLATDVDFGLDGAIYFTDWVEGWNMTGKGRLYRTFDPNERGTPLLKSVRQLISKGVHEKDLDQLEVLMNHPDMRVRRLAQFELVERGADGWERFRRLLKKPGEGFGSLHAIWGLGMAASDDSSMLEVLNPFLRDADPRIRAQTARVLGDHFYAPAATGLIAALADDDPTVRKYAALACGRLREERAFEGLVQMALQDAASDTVLRHAASWGMANCATPDALAALAGHASISVRLAAVVALRHQSNAQVSVFLDDAEPLVVSEAARAICDVPIEDGFVALAELLEREELTDVSSLRRALNANLRTGGELALQRLAALVANRQRPERLRTDALIMLGRWMTPDPRDYIISNWEPLETRPAGSAPELVRELGEVALRGPASLQLAWIDAARAFPFEGLGEIFLGIVHDRKRTGRARVKALGWLEEQGTEALETLLQASIDDPDAQLRAAALEALSRVDVEQALALFEHVLETGGILERRAVYRALSVASSGQADSLLLGEFRKMSARGLPMELHLDLVSAMYQRDSNVTRLRIDKLRQGRRQQNPRLAKWRDSFFGGDAKRGRQIFEQDAALACTRCHALGDQDAQGIGPSLVSIGSRLSRDQLVESIVVPNKRIAPGFESTLLVLASERLVAGRIISETPDLIVVLQASGELVELPATEIIERRTDLSAMPEGLDAFLTPNAMRDLVEYLSTL